MVDISDWEADIHERNKDTLSLLQQAIARFAETEGPVVRHMSDAEAYLMREIYGYELNLLNVSSAASCL